MIIFRYSNYKGFVLLFIVFNFSLHGISQSNINETASNRAAVGIKESIGYNFNIVDGKITKDSVIAVTRKFNDKGYRTETEVYIIGKLATTYQFQYLHDTLLVSMKSYRGPQKAFMQESIFEYDKNHRLIKQYDTDGENGPNFRNKFKYNKQGQLTRTTFKSMGRKIFDYKFKYDENGNKTEKISCIPTKEKFVYTYDDQNRLTQGYKVFKNGKKSLIEFYEYSDSSIFTKHRLHDTHTILGINGSIKLTHSDVLTTEIIKNTDKQVHQETEYLNGKLNGFRSYYYNK